MCAVTRLEADLPPAIKEQLRSKEGIKQLVAYVQYGIWMECDGWSTWVMALVIGGMSLAYLCIHKHTTLIRSIDVLEKSVEVLERNEAITQAIVIERMVYMGILDNSSPASVIRPSVALPAVIVIPPTPTPFFVEASIQTDWSLADLDRQVDNEAATVIALGDMFYV